MSPHHHFAGMELARQFVAGLGRGNREMLVLNLQNVETNSDGMRWLKRALNEDYDYRVDPIRSPPVSTDPCELPFMERVRNAGGRSEDTP